MFKTPFVGEILEDVGEKFRCLIYEIEDDILGACEDCYISKKLLSEHIFSVGRWFRCESFSETHIKIELIPEKRITESELQSELEKINNLFGEDKVSIPLDIIEDTYVPECKEDCNCNRCERN